MRALGVDSFEALNERASQDPSWFHDELIRFLDYRFERPYERVLDLGEGLPFAHWCVGGVTNVVINCLDRRRGTERYGQPALVWEGEDGAVSTWTFADLDRETCRLAWGLRRLGVGRGDVVGMYLPNLPHAAAAMLAVAKIGAIVLPMFSGFGADAIAQRLNDGRAVAVITVDGSARRGKPVGAKTVVDAALAHCPGVRHVVVLRHLAAPHGWTQGRDHWWDELTAGAPEDVADVATEADAGRRSLPADVHLGHQRQAERRRALALRLSDQDGAGSVDLHGPQARRPLPLDVGHGLAGRADARVRRPARRRHGGAGRRRAQLSATRPPLATGRAPPRQLPGPRADDRAPVDVAARRRPGRARPQLAARDDLHRRALDARGLALDLRARGPASRAAAQLLGRHGDGRHPDSAP